MAYIPDIVDYKAFYIQTDADDTAIDTTTWGMVAKSNPFPALPQPKEPYKNDWLDEDGDDEYANQIFYEAFEFEVQFYIKTVGENAESDLLSQLSAFFEHIRHGEFKIYDSYTGIGRRKVRYAGYNEEEYRQRIIKKDSWARAIITIKFKVNDPITKIVYNGNQLKEA